MAKKNDGKAAKRAAKKHAKEVKRRREVASRGRSAPEPLLPHEAWRPAREGLEGLAERMGISVHSAGGLAEHLVGHHGRKDAAGLWLPSKLQRMDVPAIVVALAERGVATDESRFRALAVGYVSARRFAETEWFPRLSEGHGVHDRDLCGQAAARLWGEWYPETFSDEQIDAELDGVEVAIRQEDPGGAADRLLRVWQALDPEQAPRRLEGAGLVWRFADLTSATLDEAVEEGGLGTETRSALGETLRRIRENLVLDADLGYLVGDTLDDLDWSLGRGDEVLTRLLAAAASTGDPVTALDAAALLLKHHDASVEQLQRVRDALAAILATFRADARKDIAGPVADDIEAYLADIDEALAIDPPG